MTAATVDTPPSGPLVGYRFELGCQHCGSPVRHVASGAVQTAWTRALVECCICRRTYTLTLLMEPVSTGVHRPSAPVGEPEPVRDLSAPFAPLLDQIMEATYQ